MNDGSSPESLDSDDMRRLREGDDLALNELMTRWQQTLVRHIYRFTQNETDALDLAQETFVRVYQHRQKYDSRAAFSTWLYTIATNLCRNHTRWKSRHPAISLELESVFDSTLGDRLPSSVPTPRQNAATSELSTAIASAFAELPPDQRTAAILQNYNALPNSEIAAILGCTVKAVEGKLHRARHFLREKLAPWMV